jgi:Sodium/hydrogen exchanger family
MDTIGIHAGFSGFLLGTAMPRGAYAAGLRRRLEPLAVVILLPVFFTYSGLNTQLMVVNDGRLIGIAIAVLAASIHVKGGAWYFAARFTGQHHATTIFKRAWSFELGLIDGIEKKPSFFSRAKPGVKFRRSADLERLFKARIDLLDPNEEGLLPSLTHLTGASLRFECLPGTRVGNDKNAIFLLDLMPSL